MPDIEALNLERCPNKQIFLCIYNLHLKKQRATSHKIIRPKTAVYKILNLIFIPGPFTSTVHLLCLKVTGRYVLVCYGMIFL